MTSTPEREQRWAEALFGNVVEPRTNKEDWRIQRAMALADAETAEKDAEIARLRAEVALRDAPWQEQGLWQRMKDADPVLRDQLLAAWNERDVARREAATARANCEKAYYALERVRDNFVNAVRGNPVRDMAETLAEVDTTMTALALRVVD